MDSRERVVSVLDGRLPDRVPWFEIGFHTSVAEAILGEKFKCGGYGSGFAPSEDLDAYAQDVDLLIRLTEIAGLSAIACKYWIPTLAGEQGGTGFNDEGLIKNHDDLERESARLPDIAKRDYSCGEILLEKCRANNVAGFLQAHFLVEQTIYSFGFAKFMYMIHDNRQLIEDLMDFFTEYSAQNLRNLMKLEPDFIVIGDDVAYGTGPFISPELFRELFIPRYQRLADEITCPWVFHSDGNLLPIMDDLLSLGMNAIHPIEPYGTMDIAQVKRDYGDRIALAGNLDMNIIANGDRADIEREVQRLFAEVGPGGGWILSSSNSIDSGANPENVKAMGKAVRQYCRY